MQNKCPVCSIAQNPIHIYRQPFIAPGWERVHYRDIVCCGWCGFVYVQRKRLSLESQVDYVRENKYSNQYVASLPRPSIAEYHRASFSFLHAYLSKFSNHRTMRVLDVGCSSGQFLSLFKRRGYGLVHGVDPSPTSKVLAKKWWDILVYTATIEQFAAREKYDVIVLYSVLEHLQSLKSIVKKLASMLVLNGMLFLSVPDTVRFGKTLIEPFMEISLEHINFFTEQSLSNLLGLYGFTHVASFRHASDTYGTMVLDTLWQNTGQKKRVLMCKDGILALQKYVGKSYRTLYSIERVIQQHTRRHQQYVVWGTGSLTARLLATTSLLRAPIPFFVDNNPAFHGKTLLGKPVHKPDRLSSCSMPVLIGSFLFERDIRRVLQEEYRYTTDNILSLRD